MKPNERRRLGAEQAIYRKFKTFTACSNACDQYSKKIGLDINWDIRAIARYVAAAVNLSTKRLHVLSTILGVKDTKELDEIFTAPSVRGEGLDWVGEFGTRVTDIKVNHKDAWWQL